VTVVGCVVHVYDTGLTAYRTCWYSVYAGGENRNSIEQLYDGIDCDTCFTVVTDASVSPVFLRFAVAFTVVPDMPFQLSETSTFGGSFHGADSACHLYVIRHVRFASRPPLPV